jgi:hypothetical protein
MEPSSTLTPCKAASAFTEGEPLDAVPREPSEMGRAKRCVNYVTTHWKHGTGLVRLAIQKSVVWMSLLAARNPKRCIGFVTVMSVALMGIGLLTNFTLVASDEQIFGPDGAYVIWCCWKRKWVSCAFAHFVFLPLSLPFGSPFPIPHGLQHIQTTLCIHSSDLPHAATTAHFDFSCQEPQRLVI